LLLVVVQALPLKGQLLLLLWWQQQVLRWRQQVLHVLLLLCALVASSVGCLSPRSPSLTPNHCHHQYPHQYYYC
jgi:hypothetical protein